ncbi:MAG: bidirectional hydrogenase complex protein HoxU [Sulfurimonas sp. RIFOXYD12_FULL_33_39]|uniref:2Fe-2S iron-sulfur cluster-binding protein n=1 Tax=unclassified Sulfurimonas TaxID=2623549 RepID=UPI0008D24709|nr:MULTISPECIES: 2Fe-2S iron-sulfur cluster-binding protein [unclassified Sulfurimonas]OHE10003.1 MAG: bidirectional hydrogenase complex protein HoxU [Sulfurimonas sp. RIFOXYD12_FULL_33_39]OHE14777.1 MAG: bidirectional hydrogenase complex protein HoxU [Sulfurimonas sp. RIFOXYD2_FULL_34_21]DAB28840.1 MAG TPA: bidirectional hydrogenase complex protein HoxU [Sulfurimonas sp. UBA10385]
MNREKVRVKSFTINGICVTGQSNQTILEVAKDNGIEIPTLCYLDGLSCVGSCRMCIVEIKGSHEPTPACSAKIKEGMEVTTNSPKIKKAREMILSMMFSERSHVCSTCIANGDCELQNKSVELELEHSKVSYLNQRFEIDASHKNFVNDPNRCILCTKCIRVCDEIEGAHALDIFGRGINSRIIHDMDEPWAESVSCTSCGKCVYVCPTGALYEKDISEEEVVKKRGIITELVKNRGK